MLLTLQVEFPPKPPRTLCMEGINSGTRPLAFGQLIGLTKS